MEYAELSRALYCCCFESVAPGVDLSDFQETAQRQLVEIYWSGEPTDMIRNAAIPAAGFSRDYPIGSHTTQKHSGYASGVIAILISEALDLRQTMKSEEVQL